MDNNKIFWELANKVKNSYKKNKPLFVVRSIFFVFLLITIMLGIYIWGVLIKIFSINFFYDLINPLAFDLNKPWNYFLFFVLITAVIIVVYILFMSAANKEIKPNFFLISGVYIFAFLLIFGVAFISQSYGSEFVNDLSWNIYSWNDSDEFLKNPDCSISKLNCNSLGHFNKFVIGDEIYCKFLVNESCPFVLTSLDVEKGYFNNDTTDKKEISTSNLRGIVNFELEDNLRYIFINPQFLKENSFSDVSLFWIYVYTRDRYTLEDYHQKEREKAFLIITLISISLFSTIVAMNNLKQLVKRKNE